MCVLCSDIETLGVIVFYYLIFGCCKNCQKKGKENKQQFDCQMSYSHSIENCLNYMYVAVQRLYFVKVLKLSLFRSIYLFFFFFFTLFIFNLNIVWLVCPLQIKREISTMKLIRHPNVIRMHEVAQQLCLILFLPYLNVMA